MARIGNRYPTCQPHCYARIALGNELSEFDESLGRVKEPVAESESEDSGLVRDYGLLVVPLELSKEEAELLIAELKTSGIEHKTQ